MSGSNSEKWLKSVYIYGSYCKNEIGVPFFLDHPVVAPKFVHFLAYSCPQLHVCFSEDNLCVLKLV